MLFPVALAVVAILWLGVPGLAEAQGNQEVITSTGPMTQIYLNNDLSCQVQMANDMVPSFYGGTNPGACGTFMQVNAIGLQLPNELFGPSSVPVSDAPITATFTPDPSHPQMLTGAGTAASPYTVTTTADACTASPCVNAPIAILTETDTYVVGDNFYATSLTINDSSGVALTGTVYHAGDCYLQSHDSGYGALGAGGAPECALSPSDSPPGRVMSFIPGSSPSPTSAYFEGAFDSFWSDITTTGTQYPDTIDASTSQDNGLGLSWSYSLLGFGDTTTIGYTTLISPAQAPTNTAPPVVSGTPAVGQTLSCSTGSWSGSGPITYTYQWLQDGSPIAAETNNTYTVVSGDQGHSVACQVAATNGIASATQPSAAVNVPAPAPTVPAAVGLPPSVIGTQGAGFSATVNPEGSATTVHFEYGLDPKYGLTTAANLYVAQTPAQPLGAGFNTQIVTTTVTGLVPNALYHVRVVATNAVGSVTGADQRFTTAAIPNPPAPVLGLQANFAPTSGVVYVKPPPGTHPAALHANAVHATARASAKPNSGPGFIPLTEALQLPVGTQVDARRGTLKVTTATTPSKKGKRTRTQSALFSQGLFAVAQSNKRSLKGLTILSLLDTGIFPGAPSYKTQCATITKLGIQAREHGTVVFRRRRLNHRALQTLLSSGHGSYRTQGRYSAATVRGTIYTVTDRCDGTLTQVKRGTVIVSDFRLHKNITVRIGHSYLAEAP